LRTNRHRLRREDLEDCYSQATLELLAHVRAGGRYASRAHLANALELRFSSRVQDRRRALAGRSPMEAALEGALFLDATTDTGFGLVDGRADVEALVLLRHDLRRAAEMARQLTADQRLVLAAQLGPFELGCAEFCRRFGWSSEKYRKVAQRARGRLGRLMAGQPAVPQPGRASEERAGTDL